MPGTNPYAYPEPGTAAFPIDPSDCSEPDLAFGVNAVFEAQVGALPGTWEWPGEGGTAPLPATMSLYPDAVNTLNYLADAASVISISISDPGSAAAFANPAHGSSPDAVQGINYLYDIK